MEAALHFIRNTALEGVTDMSNNKCDQIAQLFRFFRTCNMDFNIFWNYSTDAGEDIFNCVYELLQQINLLCSKLASINGAPSMTGKPNITAKKI